MMIRWLISFTLVVLLPFVSLAKEIVIETLPAAKNGEPIYFVFQGEEFSEPKQLEGKNSKEIDRSSPASVVEAFLGTVFEGNTNRYNELYPPGEIPESYLAPGSAGKELKLALKANLFYGDFVLSLLEVKGMTWPKLLKRVGGKYYLTDELNRTDPSYKLVQSFELKPSSKTVTDLAGMLSDTNHPLGNAQSQSPLRIFYSGSRHVPPKELKQTVQRSAQDLKTPEGALIAIHSATLLNDPDWYMSLISPADLDSSGDMIRRGLTNSLKTTSSTLKKNRITVDLEIRYAGYAIYIFGNSEKERTEKEQSYLVFKQHEKQWLLTDELNGDSFVNYLRHAEINSSAAFPRIYFFQ